MRYIYYGVIEDRAEDERLDDAQAEEALSWVQAFDWNANRWGNLQDHKVEEEHCWG